MRLSSGAALLAFAPVVLGWRMTLYSQEDCNDHDGDFSYYIIKGSGSMTYCAGLVAEPHEMPEGVICSYYSQKGAVGPEDCNGQMKEALSFKIGRGNAQFWEEFDTDDYQAIEKRCRQRLINFPRASDGGKDFHASTECRNTYYHEILNEKIQSKVGGYLAWD